MNIYFAIIVSSLFEKQFIVVVFFQGNDVDRKTICLGTFECGKLIVGSWLVFFAIARLFFT